MRNLLRPLRRRMTMRDKDWHRDAVGGMWEEIGRLQLDCLVSQGLEPAHHLLDVGCGSLRGGCFFIRYLDAGHYFGIEKERALIRAGTDVEIPRHGLQDKRPHLVVTDSFDLDLLGGCNVRVRDRTVGLHPPRGGSDRTVCRARNLASRSRWALLRHVLSRGPCGAWS